VDNWKKLTNSRNRVRKKSFGGTFCFSNCHIIELDVSGFGHILVVIILKSGKFLLGRYPEF
jgi:hypothetical protein